jgi:predicted small secreted protein
MTADNTLGQQSTGMKMQKLLIIGAALLALAACNTIGGVGEDITAGADTVAGML